MKSAFPAEDDLLGKAFLDPAVKSYFGAMDDPAAAIHTASVSDIAKALPVYGDTPSQTQAAAKLAEVFGPDWHGKFIEALAKKKGVPVPPPPVVPKVNPNAALNHPSADVIDSFVAPDTSQYDFNEWVNSLDPDKKADPSTDEGKLVAHLESLYGKEWPSHLAVAVASKHGLSVPAKSAQALLGTVAPADLTHSAALGAMTWAPTSDALSDALKNYETSPNPGYAKYAADMKAKYGPHWTHKVAVAMALKHDLPVHPDSVVSASVPVGPTVPADKSAVLSGLKAKHGVPYAALATIAQNNADAAFGQAVSAIYDFSKKGGDPTNEWNAAMAELGPHYGNDWTALYHDLKTHAGPSVETPKAAGLSLDGDSQNTDALSAATPATPAVTHTDNTPHSPEFAQIFTQSSAYSLLHLRNAIQTSNPAAMAEYLDNCEAGHLHAYGSSLATMMGPDWRKKVEKAYAEYHTTHFTPLSTGYYEGYPLKTKTSKSIQYLLDHMKETSSSYGPYGHDVAKAALLAANRKTVLKQVTMSPTLSDDAFKKLQAKAKEIATAINSGKDLGPGLSKALTPKEIAEYQKFGPAWPHALNAFLAHEKKPLLSSIPSDWMAPSAVLAQFPPKAPYQDTVDAMDITGVAGHAFDYDPSVWMGQMNLAPASFQPKVKSWAKESFKKYGPDWKHKLAAEAAKAKGINPATVAGLKPEYGGAAPGAPSPPKSAPDTLSPEEIASISKFTAFQATALSHWEKYLDNFANASNDTTGAKAVKALKDKYGADWKKKVYGALVNHHAAALQKLGHDTDALKKNAGLPVTATSAAPAAPAAPAEGLAAHEIAALPKDLDTELSNADPANWVDTLVAQSVYGSPQASVWIKDLQKKYGDSWEKKALHSLAVKKGLDPKTAFLPPPVQPSIPAAVQGPPPPPANVKNATAVKSAGAPAAENAQEKDPVPAGFTAAKNPKKKDKIPPQVGSIPALPPPPVPKLAEKGLPVSAGSKALAAHLGALQHGVKDESGKEWLAIEPKSDQGAHAGAAALSSASLAASIASFLKPGLAYGQAGPQGTLLHPVFELGDPPTLAGIPPSALSESELEDVASEHVLDWLTGHHRTHGGRLVRTADGRIVGAGKTHAFGYLGADVLSTSYHPGYDSGEPEPYYNKFWEDWAKGKHDFDPMKLKAHFDSIDSIDPTGFQAAVTEHFKNVHPGQPDVIEDRVQDAMARKATARTEFEGFLTDLYRRRTGKKKGLFSFDDGWQEAPDEPYEVPVPLSEHAASLGITTHPYKDYTGKFPVSDGSKIILKIPNSNSIDVIYDMLKEAGIAPFGGPYTGSMDHKVAVDKAEFEKAVSGKTKMVVPAKALDATPKKPKHFPKVAKLAHTALGADHLKSLDTHSFHYTGQAFHLDGGAMEGQALKAKKVKDKDGEHYLFAFKLRQGQWKPLAAKGAKGTYGFHIGTYNPSTGTLEATSLTSDTVDTRLWKTGSHEVHLATGDDKKYAYKGSMYVKVRPKAGQKIHDALEEALNGVQPGLAKDLLRDPTPQEKELARLSRLLWARAPQVSDKLDKEELTDPGARTLAKVKTLLKTAGVTQEEMDSVREREVYPGHFSHVLPGRWRKTGAKFLFQGTTKAEGVVNMLKSGLMGIHERNHAGLAKFGGSYDADVVSGSGDGTLCRVMTENGLTHRLSSHNFSGNYQVVVAPTELDRLDSYMHAGDEFGVCKDTDSRWTNRDTVEDNIKNLRSYYSESNEISFRKGVPPSRILRVACQSENSRQELINQAKASGLTHVNGVPIEDFVVVGNKAKDIYEKYVKPLGY